MGFGGMGCYLEAACHGQGVEGGKGSNLLVKNGEKIVEER